MSALWIILYLDHLELGCVLCDREELLCISDGGIKTYIGVHMSIYPLL